jgi:hypothetical protein
VSAADVCCHQELTSHLTGSVQQYLKPASHSLSVVLSSEEITEEPLRNQRFLYTPEARAQSKLDGVGETGATGAAGWIE